MAKRIAALLPAILLLALRPAGGAAAQRQGAEPPATAAHGGLWQKSLDVFAKNRAWYPEKISVHSEVLDRHGDPYSITELFFATRIDADGRMLTELTRALKNGRDISQEMKAKVEIRHEDDGMPPQKEESLAVSLSDSPFDPERQERVEFHPGAERLKLFGHRCRRFDFSYRTQIVRKGRTEELTWNGMAWLDEASGVPVKLEFAVAPLPGRIRSLWTIYLYDTARADKWVVKSIAIAGRAGFLFINKRFRSITLFREYRLRKAKEAKE
jgi:hypothetical protein